MKKSRHLLAGAIVGVTSNLSVQAHAQDRVADTYDVVELDQVTTGGPV